MLSDFLLYLMATSYSAGIATRAGIERSHGRPRECDREFELRLDYLGDRMRRISYAMGRPVSKKVPSSAFSYRTEWGLNHLIGVLCFIAEKEGWYCSELTKYRWRAEQCLKAQHELMDIYQEALQMYPHYAVNEIPIDPYRNRKMYFDAIERYREREPENEYIFGDPNGSGDPEFDSEIRRLFDSIDQSFPYKTRYHIVTYSYTEKNNKMMAALNKVSREDGFDSYDFWTGTPFHGLDMMNFVKMYYDEPRTKERIQVLRNKIFKDTAWKCAEATEDQEVQLEMLKYLLKSEHYNLIDFNL